MATGNCTASASCLSTGRAISSALPLTYAYDALNRMTVKVVPGSTTHTRDVYYTYDLRNLMTSARFDSMCSA